MKTLYWTEDLIKGKLFCLAKNRREAEKKLSQKACHPVSEIRHGDEQCIEQQHTGETSWATD